MNTPDLKSGKIFVFSAPSGAGKTTLLNYLKTAIPGLVYSISATTRKPRRGEINGTHYFFMKEEEFKKKADTGEFAEWAVVHGNFYGTPRTFIDSVIESGRHVIMDIDVAGKKKFDIIYPHAIGVLILPPGLDALERRLRARKSDDEASILLRLENAKKEIEFARDQGKYEYTVINDDLSKTKQEIVDLVKFHIKSGSGA